jgi:YHS domain-containing protein
MDPFRRRRQVRFEGDEEDTMAMVTDPVCGMQIEPDDAAGTAEYEGTTYYFCSQACLDAFEADPTAYVT